MSRGRFEDCACAGPSSQRFLIECPPKIVRLDGSRHELIAGEDQIGPPGRNRLLKGSAHGHRNYVYVTGLRTRMAEAPTVMSATTTEERGVIIRSLRASNHP